MPGVLIEQDIRTMLGANAALVAQIPTARMSYAYRLQDGIMPALTYEITSLTQESIAGGTAVKLARVEMTVIAAITLDAINLIGKVKAACAAGTYGVTQFDAVIWNGYTIAGAVVGEGDEQQPAEATATVDIYYRE